MDEKKTLVSWIKEHKKELIIAGVSVAGIIALIVGFKNQDQIIAALESLKRTISKTPVSLNTEKVIDIPTKAVIPIEITESSVSRSLPVDTVPFSVSSHIRNLHEGWSPSAEKIALAAERGYDLKKGQTWVEEYMKGGLAA